MDEQENFREGWLHRHAAGRKILKVKDWLAGSYYHHFDRYHQASQSFYRGCTWLAAIIALLLVAAGAWWIVRPSYQHYQEERGARRAEVFLEQHDYRDAQLCARQALAINPMDVSACRVMAELADLAHSPVSLAWQQRVVAAEPTVQNKLLLAAAGLRYQRPPFALTTSILAELPPNATTNATYQLIAATLAMAQNQIGDAEGHFVTAAALDPTNPADTLDLAILRLGMTNETKRVQSRQTLERMAADPDWGSAALRAMVSDRLANHDLTGASQFSAQLLASGKADLTDELQNLAILRQTTNQNFSNQLTALEARLATNASSAASLSLWMQAHGLAANTLSWLTNLPESIRTQQPVVLALAGGYLEAGEWRSLRNFASQGNWKSFEFLRFALVSHALAQLGNQSLADVNWNAAANEAEGSYQASVKLVELAAAWDLKREREDLLVKLVKRFPKERWPTLALTQLYFSEGRTAAINELSDRMMLLYPGEIVYRNNLAATALLLKTNLPAAFTIAAAAYTNSPANPDEATTYAYALHLQGRDREGLSLLQKLSPTQLNNPSVALYYGLLLEANGQHEDAVTWLQIAQTNSHLLPEEKQLLLSALAK